MSAADLGALCTDIRLLIDGYDLALREIARLSTPSPPGRVYSDEFYAAIDAQDFELALAIRDNAQ